MCEKIEGFEIINPECKYFFVGSSTTQHSRAMGFPYMNSVISGDRNRNKLWVILGKVFSENESEFKLKESKYRHADCSERENIANEMKKLLKQHNIGLFDMIESCWFDNDQGINNDKNIIFNDNEHPLIIKNILHLKDKVFIINGSLKPSKYKKRIIDLFCEKNSICNYVKILNIFAYDDSDLIVKKLQETIK